MSAGSLLIPLLGALAGLMLSSPLAALSDEDVQAPLSTPIQTVISDGAQVLSDEFEKDLLQRLDTIEVRTSMRMVVVTSPSLLGTPSDQVADRLLDQWSEANAAAQHTVILLLAPREREFTVQVRSKVPPESYYGRDDAYWFEQGVAPPSFVASLKSVITPAVVPHFRKSEWESGIAAAITALETQITGSSTANGAEAT